MFNHGMEIVTLLSGLTLLCDLQSITCGVISARAWKTWRSCGLKFMCNLQSTTCGVKFNYGMGNVTLLSGSTLLCGLQSIT